MKQKRQKSHAPRRALISLGGNLPHNNNNLAETVRKATQDVASSIGRDARASRFYHTPAFPAGAGPDFVNAAMSVDTALTGPEVLAALHEIEAAAQRSRETRWGARTLDLDLIALDDIICPDLNKWRYWFNLTLDRQVIEIPDKLILPHPRMQDRSFVLVPLADVAPDWCHPVLGLTVTQMRDALDPDDLATVRALN